jgi:hypothetical protein
MHIINDLDDALGLRELRAKVNHKAGIKQADLKTTLVDQRNTTRSMPNPCVDMPIRFSVFAELWYDIEEQILEFLASTC